MRSPIYSKFENASNCIQPEQMDNISKDINDMNGSDNIFNKSRYFSVQLEI